MTSRKKNKHVKKHNEYNSILVALIMMLDYFLQNISIIGVNKFTKKTNRAINYNSVSSLFVYVIIVRGRGISRRKCPYPITARQKRSVGLRHSPVSLHPPPPPPPPPPLLLLLLLSPMQPLYSEQYKAMRRARVLRVLFD